MFLVIKRSKNIYELSADKGSGLRLKVCAFDDWWVAEYSNDSCLPPRSHLSSLQFTQWTEIDWLVFGLVGVRLFTDLPGARTIWALVEVKVEVEVEGSHVCITNRNAFYEVFKYVLRANYELRLFK